ncbi:MAG: hypothetical protein H0U96_01030 [Acidobacteria bacterium]|jgi:hypothetical protein|nr:hypothetical protein [Acidobacteriota bacterium]
MIFNFGRIIFVSFLIFVGNVCLNAQGDASTASGKPSSVKEDYPKSIKESLAKQRIETEKKDFQELLARGEEVAKLSHELEKSFAQNNSLTPEDEKKLNRVEKLVKKIRSEIGADSVGDDERGEIEPEEKPSNVLNALKSLQSTTGKLVAELKKQTRHTVSVVAIQSSNILLKVVRFIRFRKN